MLFVSLVEFLYGLFDLTVAPASKQVPWWTRVAVALLLLIAAIIAAIFVSGLVVLIVGVLRGIAAGAA